MLHRLQKLAGVSKSLRKQAGALGLIGSGIVKHPIAAGAATVGTIQGIGKARQSKVGFHPNTHKLLTGTGQ